MNAPSSYYTQKIVIAITITLSMLYLVVVLYPAYTQGLYRISTAQLIYGDVVTPGTSGSIFTLLILAMVFLGLVPILSITLLTVIFGHKRLHLEHRLFWMVIIIELITFLLLSYPISDKLVDYILYS